MKRTYQIRELKAIEKFRSHLANDPGVIKRPCNGRSGIESCVG